ncbi:MAG: adenylyltransferase/cytidyltransferase family protein [Candidatus Jordarchaeum sp.]|uniref:adenylyltransferase/cytidyltransferase family protein n=1 Tax=Candidatus Jordarchaeum sp. TaxID=2823881 RepID=UPI00404AE255
MTNQVKKVRVMAFGTFDLVHIGHIKFLEEAKKLGGNNSELIVVISRDTTAERIKKQAPIFNEDERKTVIQALKPVDKAVLGYKGKDMLQIVEENKPDIIVLGYDQRIGTEEFQKLRKEIKERGIKAKLIRMPKYSTGLNSSTIIVKKILERNKNNLQNLN